MATPAQPANDPTAKLQQMIQVCVDNAVLGLKEHVTVQVQNLQIQVGQLEVQLKTLNTAIVEGAAAKAKPRTTKKTTDAAPPAAEGGGVVPDATAPAEAAQDAAAADGKKFPNNPYNWFTAKFKSDKAFRDAHLTPTNLDLMKNEELIAKRKTDQEKITPQAKFLWSYYKSKNAAVHTALTTQFEQERDAHNKANAPPQPAQQVKEANSPATAKK